MCSAAPIVVGMQNTQGAFIENYIAVGTGFPIFGNVRHTLLWCLELAVTLVLWVFVEFPIGHGAIKHISMRCARIMHAMADRFFHILC